ncbi:MAG: MerC domain-containing protein [Verrucomicrobiales bacterium]|nr:MerC domain-containing protein [Verrucomicrobiales bacterium]
MRPSQLTIGKRVYRYSAGVDGVGLAASSLCIVHCLGTAALGFLLPALGLTFLIDERIHRLLAAIVVGAGLLAFVPGFRLHRSWLVAVLATLGLAAIALSQLLPDESLRERLETGLTLFGGGMLVIAHIQNRALCRKCRCRDCQALK